MSYPDPPTYTPPQPPSPAKPPHKRTRWYANRWIIGLGALLIGLLIGIGAGSGSAKTSTKTVAKPGPTVTATATVQAAAAAPVTHTVTAHPVVKKVIATHVQVRTVTYTPPPKAGFGDGTYLVGTDIKPGLYRTDGQGDGSGIGCYWERMKDLKGSVYSINANDNIDGPTVVEVYSSDKAFKVSGGCTWRRA